MFVAGFCWVSNTAPPQGGWLVPTSFSCFVCASLAPHQGVFCLLHPPRAWGFVCCATILCKLVSKLYISHCTSLASGIDGPSRLHPTLPGQASVSSCIFLLYVHTCFPLRQCSSQAPARRSRTKNHPYSRRWKCNKLISPDNKHISLSKDFYPAHLPKFHKH